MARDPDAPPAPGNDLILGGLGIGAIGVVGALALGATCPVCVVAAPGLVGAGLFQKWRARRAASRPAQAQEIDGSPERGGTEDDGSAGQ